MEVLVNALVGIILPYITVSNQHAAHPKLTVLYVNYISIKLEKKFIKKERNLPVTSLESIKSQGGHAPVPQVQVQYSWGGGRTAYSLVTCPRLSALAPAAGGN